MITAFDINTDSILTGKGPTWHTLLTTLILDILFDKNLSESDYDTIINKIRNEKKGKIQKGIQIPCVKFEEKNFDYFNYFSLFKLFLYTDLFLFFLQILEKEIIFIFLFFLILHFLIYFLKKYWY